MRICKNAIEYQKILTNLQADFVDEVRPKERDIRDKYKKKFEKTPVEEWKQILDDQDNEIRDLYKTCLKNIENFINSQPKHPIYVFKKNRRYYILKWDWITGDNTKSPVPIASIQLLRRKNPGWVFEYIFPGTAFDYVICPNCEREFTKFKPNEKFCPTCRRSPRSKRALINKKDSRYCQNLGCKKPIPGFRRSDAKYCCDACKTAACEKRKSC